MASTVSVITSSSASEGYLARCWEQRGLLWFFARRDLVVRYRQTLFGVAWVLLRPVLGMGVLGFLFGRVANLPSYDIPYPLVVLIGMLPWQYFASVLSEGAGSIANNPSLITKVYFPRLLMPASGLLLNTADLLVHIAFLAAVMLWYGILPPLQVVLAPLSFVIMAATALGTALWVSALAVRYRDVRSLVPVAIQFGILVTPVAFLTTAVPIGWRWAVWLNPLAGAIEWLRWCLLPGIPCPSAKALALSVGAAALVLVSGYGFFRRAEGRFADVI